MVVWFYVVGFFECLFGRDIPTISHAFPTYIITSCTNRNVIGRFPISFSHSYKPFLFTPSLTAYVPVSAAGATPDRYPNSSGRCPGVCRG
jgi:hypothetical protein